MSRGGGRGDAKEEEDPDLLATRLSNSHPKDLHRRRCRRGGARGARLTNAVFAPFWYDGLSSRRWDLVLVEGYTGSVPAFIHEVRARNREVVVLFYCLDTYPSLSTVGNLDVDAFLTNSRVLLPLLQQISPASRLLHLAADPLVMREVPPHPKYEDHTVVYLGQFKRTKHRIVETLIEVAPLGLSIYGGGWDLHEDAAELLPFWRGVLPLGDIASLYASAKVVMSTTEEQQRSLGMVNNRVFEALSCGAAVVSDSFPEMEAVFGDHVLYYRQAGDAKRAVEPLPSGGPTTTTAIAMSYRDTTVAVISERSRHCGEPTTAILHHDLVALSVFSELAQDGDTAKAVIPALPQHGASTAAAANSTAVSKHSRMGRGESITATVDPDKSVSGAISRLVKTNRATSTNTTAPTYRDTAAAAVTPELTQTGASTAAVAVDSDKAAAGHDTPAKGKAECNPTTRLGDTNKCRRGRDRYQLPPAMVGSENQPAREGTTNATSGNAFSRGLNSSGSSATTPPSHGRNKPASVSSAPNTSNRGREPTVPESSADNAFRRGRIKPVPEVNNSHHHPQQASIALRPNAPMVLVIYRSESPPPKSLRRNIETSVDDVAGGARLGFLGVGEAFSHASTTRGGEEWARWRELEHHLSRLLLAGEERRSGSGVLTELGMDAAVEAIGYLEWCCSVGLVAVYAQEGDVLERHFLHYIAGDKPFRTVRTGLLVPWGPSREPSHLPPNEMLALTFRMDRYELVHKCWQISRHAKVSISAPTEGTMVAARRSDSGDRDNWATVSLSVKVYHPYFRAPDDGQWCIILDQVEVGCRGDDDPAGVVDRSQTLAMEIEVDPQALPRFATIEAVLKGGSLEAPRVVRRSKPVSVTVWPVAARDAGAAGD
eukprot:jgi/Undpi1/7618/HiC_scaffold_23.g10091.m1